MHEPLDSYPRHLPIYAGMMQGRVFGLLNSMYSGFLPIGMRESS